MILFLTILLSIIIFLALVTSLLYLFTKMVLKNKNSNISKTILALLVIQFILGMINNLWVSIPKVKSYEIYHYLGPVSIHTVNALFLLIFSTFFLINAFKNNEKKRPALAGLIGIVVATIGGVSFVNSGGENDIYSFIMSLGFLEVFLVYTYTTFAKPKRK